MAEDAVESPQPETSAGPAAGSIRSPSPPPNCAICLGNCVNKSFPDSCLHQFCFKCLQEWSKVKAECPLCKIPFQSIIHNVKSIHEYDQYYISQSTSRPDRYAAMFLPRLIPQESSNTSRHFQFRTTLTVEPRGELAIQQLRSSDLNSLPQYTTLNVLRNAPYYFRQRHARDVSSSLYRRSLYDRNLWTSPLTDTTGRFRDVSPTFFREGPAIKNRLVPFLQRELNALIPEGLFEVMHFVQRILTALDDHPIRGRFLKHMLQPELGSFTEHFIHEFYTYARSPYDMSGFDQHSQVMTQVPPQHESSDSDVLIVSVERAPPRLPPTSSEVIEIGSESSRDSDVVIREPSPPVLVDLANTTESCDVSAHTCNGCEQAQNNRQMPAKMRYKRGRKQMPKTLRRRHRVDSSNSSSDSATATTSSSDSSPRPRKMLLKVKEYKSSPENSSDSSCDDAARERPKKRKKLRKKRSLRKSEATQSSIQAVNTSIKYEPVQGDIEQPQAASTL